MARTILVGIVSLLTIVAAWAAEPQPKASGNNAPELKAAQEERITVLTRLVEVLAAQYKSGQVSVADVFSAEHELCNAVLDSSDESEKKIALLTKLADRANEVLASTQARFANGQASESDVLRAKSGCLGIKIKLLREHNAVPTESDAEAFVHKRISENPNLFRYRVVGFRKTNGVKMEEHGVPMYMMYYTVDIEFTEDCFFAKGEEEWGVLRGFTYSTTQGPSAGIVLVKKGQRERTEGRAKFEKTENGWLPCKGQL